MTPSSSSHPRSYTPKTVEDVAFAKLGEIYGPSFGSKHLRARLWWPQAGVSFHVLCPWLVTVPSTTALRYTIACGRLYLDGIVAGCIALAASRFHGGGAS